MFIETISKIFKKHFFKPKFEKEDLKKIIKELRISLLKADIPPTYSSKIAKEIEEKVEEYRKYSNDLREVVIRASYDVLTEHLGEEGKKEMEGIILFIGLLGSGKTTTIGKIALYLRRLKKKVLTTSLDFRRKAAMEQIEQLSKKAGVDYLIFKENVGLDEAINKILREREKYNAILVDTSGRNVLDREMLEELREIYKKINPNFVILVVSADMGYRSIEYIKKMNEYVNIDGIIISKFDSSSKAGGILVASKELRIPILFLGVGERLEDLEEFDKDSLVSRILGIGDIKSIVRKFDLLREELEIKEYKGIDAELIYDSINFLEKMGSLKRLLSLIPLGPFLNVSDNVLAYSEEKLKKFKAIILSLNKKEMKNPFLARRRAKEIAKGAGVKEKDVYDFLEFVKQIKSLEPLLKKESISQEDIQKIISKQFRRRFRR